MLPIAAAIASTVPTRIGFAICVTRGRSSLHTQHRA